MKKCPYCGNNPVPHKIYWYNESLNILLTPVRQKVLFNPLTALLKKKGLGKKLVEGVVWVWSAIGAITSQGDKHKCKISRAEVMWEEAEKRGVEMKELLLFGKPFDTYTAEKSKIKNQKSKIIFSGLPRPEGYSNNLLDLMDDKWLFKKMLMQENLPVPAGAAVTSFREAVKVFDRINNSSFAKASEDLRPVIVKPRAGSRGRHSTTYVYTKEELKRAFKIAKQLCYWVMVEEQIFGPVYRGTVINFQLAGVLRGDSPQVEGDGKQSIAELVKEKNSNPHPGVKDILLDEGAEVFLARQGLNFSSVLKQGQVVATTEKIGVNYGGSSSEDYEICHPDTKELFVRAARLLGDPLVGFDFIIPDITKSYKEQKCGFLEVNSLPFINLHHDPLRGTPRNAAAMVWEMVGM